MKRFVLILSVAASVAACSEKEQLFVNPEGDGLIRITATADAVKGTRVSITDGTSGKKQLLWSTGDRIAVYVTPDNVPFTLESGEMTSRATFIGEPGIYTACDDGCWAALYPYRTGSYHNVTMDSNNKDHFGCVLNAYQRATDNSFDRESFLMLAHSATLGEFAFKPVVSLLKVTPQFDCKQIFITARQGSTYARIAGVGRFMWENGKPVMSEFPYYSHGFNSTSISLSGNIKAGVDYYICVFPMTIPEGFDLSFLAADGTMYVRGSDNPFTPEMGKIYDMGEFSVSGTPWTEVKAAPNANGHSYIDLGLVIDGHKIYFADRNLGADAVDGTGDYYYWGSTSPNPSTNGYSPGKTTIDIGGNASYDAAASNWGGDWRMPSSTHLLFIGYETPCVDLVSADWDTSHSVAGYTVTSMIPGYEGASIFIPAAGYYSSGAESIGKSGMYWCSDYYSSNTKYKYFYFNSYEKKDNYRTTYKMYYTIRPVIVQ